MRSRIGALAGALLFLAAAAAPGAQLLPQTLLAAPGAAYASSAARVGTVAIGSYDVRLEATTLAAVQRSLGGRIIAGGDGGNSWRALCYRMTADSSAVWLISTELGGPDGRIMLVAADVAQPWSGCATPRAAVIFDPQPLPGFGSTPAQLAHYFGRRAEGGASVAFERVTPLPHSGTRIERITYFLKHGIVSRVVLSRVTTR